MEWGLLTSFVVGDRTGLVVSRIPHNLIAITHVPPIDVKTRIRQRFTLSVKVTTRHERST